jgi:signal transduction histidine kinase
MPDASIPIERKLELLEEELRHARRMAALGELASTTTHEFNNVLMTVLNYAKMGLRHTDEPTRTKALDKILTASNRASKITAAILGMARNRSNDFEPTDLAALIEDTLLLLEREMHKYRVQVEREIEQVPPAQANGNQIQQVLLNLMTNARQAMPEGGRMIIKLSHDPASGTVDLMLRDFGSGIAADKLPQIFEPYYTTKSGPDDSGKGGTGLGLSACREIIEAHRGKIRVESSEGKGTAFTLKIPLAEKKPAAILPTESSFVADAASVGR